MTETHNALHFPSMEILRGASRETLLDILDVLESKQREGLLPPHGYLFALSQEIMRVHAQTLK